MISISGISATRLLPKEEVVDSVTKQCVATDSSHMRFGSEKRLSDELVVEDVERLELTDDIHCLFDHVDCHQTAIPFYLALRSNTQRTDKYRLHTALCCLSLNWSSD